MGKGDTPRPRQISQEEYNLRWAYGKGETDLTEEQMKKRIVEIRKRCGTKF